MGDRVEGYMDNEYAKKCKNAETGENGTEEERESSIEIKKMQQMQMNPMDACYHM